MPFFQKPSHEVDIEKGNNSSGITSLPYKTQQLLLKYMAETCRHAVATGAVSEAVAKWERVRAKRQSTLPPASVIIRSWRDITIDLGSYLAPLIYQLFLKGRKAVPNPGKHPNAVDTAEAVLLAMLAVDEFEEFKERKQKTKKRSGELAPSSSQKEARAGRRGRNAYLAYQAQYISGDNGANTDNVRKYVKGNESLAERLGLGTTDISNTSEGGLYSGGRYGTSNAPGFGEGGQSITTVFGSNSVEAFGGMTIIGSLPGSPAPPTPSEFTSSPEPIEGGGRGGPFNEISTRKVESPAPANEGMTGGKSPLSVEGAPPSVSEQQAAGTPEGRGNSSPKLSEPDVIAGETFSDNSPTTDSPSYSIDEPSYNPANDFVDIEVNIFTGEINQLGDKGAIDDTTPPVPLSESDPAYAAIEAYMTSELFDIDTATVPDNVPGYPGLEALDTSITAGDTAGTDGGDGSASDSSGDAGGNAGGSGGGSAGGDAGASSASSGGASSGGSSGTGSGGGS